MAVKKLNWVTKSPLAYEIKELGDAGFLVAAKLQEAYNLLHLPVVE